MRNKTKLKKTGIYLKEHLTLKNFNIFYQAREARRLGHITNAWTIDGLVLVAEDFETALGILSNYDYLVELNLTGKAPAKSNSAEKGDKNGDVSVPDQLHAENGHGNGTTGGTNQDENGKTQAASAPEVGEGKTNNIGQDDSGVDNGARDFVIEKSDTGEQSRVRGQGGGRNRQPRCGTEHRGGGGGTSAETVKAGAPSSHGHRARGPNSGRGQRSNWWDT